MTGRPGGDNGSPKGTQERHLRVLDDDSLDELRDVFAVIDRLFEQGVDVLPLEDFDRLCPVVEQAGDGRAADPIALVLDPMDFDDKLVDILEAPEIAQGLFDSEIVAPITATPTSRSDQGSAPSANISACSRRCDSIP